MDLLALDADFQPVGYLPYTNLQWTREYYTTGQFSAQVAPDSYDPSMRYLYTPERPEVGIIQKVELTSTVKGRTLQISGFFLESMLSTRVVWPTYYATGDLTSAVTKMLQTYAGDLPLVEIPDAPAGLAEDAWQETGGTVAETAYTRLQTQQKSIRARYDYLANKIVIEVWQGLDRTQSQDVNPFVTFSDGFGNLTDVKASWDDSNYRNYAIIAGEGENNDRIFEIVDASNGAPIRQVFINASQTRWDQEKQTEEQYRQSLRQEATDRLLDYQIIRNIDISAAQGGLRYREDYDLGDKVDVMLPEIGLEMEARIITAREVHKQGHMTLEIELGDKKLTRLKKARMTK